MPQYHVAQQDQARALTAKAHASFLAASAAGNTSDKYVRLTVILATVLFLIGISGHFSVPPRPLRADRHRLRADHLQRRADARAPGPAGLSAVSSSSSRA